MLEIHFFETNFFDQNIPLLRRKQSAFDIQDLPGLWRIHWQIGDTTILSTFYTRIDQACLLWGVISVGIFAIAQFTFLDWGTQALISSLLSLAGILGMVGLAQYIAHVEPLRHVIYAWVVLMSLGVLITDLSIFLGWAQILAQICTLWLGLSALGYFYTGVKMRSRAFFAVSLLHLLGIMILPYVTVWQFLATGLVIGLSSILLAELQWDSSGACDGHQLTEEH